MQVFSPIDGTQPVVGVIGALQLDVLADRLFHEYGLKTDYDPAPCDAVPLDHVEGSRGVEAFPRKQPLVYRHRSRRQLRLHAGIDFSI